MEARSRGYLPHIDHAHYQFITYRLADSLPTAAVKSLHLITDSNKRKRQLEVYLDAGYGFCLLAKDQHAQTVLDSWRYSAGKSYDLIAYVIMPNHVHLLIHPYQGQSLDAIVQRWKSYTAHMLNQQDKTSGRSVWMPDYWDRYIRDEQHFNRSVEYIHNNPVQAGLVGCAEDWCYSSIHGFKLPWEKADCKSGHR
ncbi:REP-associated tyrosine transposase [Reinekea marinisedimentorum]|uniref:Putative DNA methylase n=1 Tax=Reinekea marinisedimentorum TaxID=230495 RepID=A0A4V2UKD3_9GAMM|nr:transposase [Reinekea marinisedimentorum]TCS43943.1 putative DNA methylase [Reinekea marinisedimentorum]